MLVLTRKSMERIQIGDSVVVTVLEIGGNKVRIGITAPKEIRVLRSELKEASSDFLTDLASDTRGLLTTRAETALPDVLHN